MSENIKAVPVTETDDEAVVTEEQVQEFVAKTKKIAKIVAVIGASVLAGYAIKTLVDASSEEDELEIVSDETPTDEN